MRLELHPCTVSAEEVLERNPDAASSPTAPGDPAALDYVVDNVRGLVGEVPVWGICLGHQLSLPGRRPRDVQAAVRPPGANHLVKDLQTGKIEITSQNHGFAVVGPGGEQTIDIDEPVRWETDFGAAELSQLNLYDRTVEGLVLKDVPASTVQYHPEAGPGLHDALHLFDRFLETLAARVPRRDDIRKILVIGSGPIVIGRRPSSTTRAPRRARCCWRRATRSCSSTPTWRRS